MSKAQEPQKPALTLADLEGLMQANKPMELIEAMGTYLKTVSENFSPRDLQHSLQSLRGTIATLKKDTDQCYARYQEASKSWVQDKQKESYELLQFELRQLIRTFFAEVEGTIFSGRQIILWANERGEIELTLPEQALLREESYRFNRKTKRAESRATFNSTLDAFLLTLSVLPRLFGSESTLDLSRHGWESFQGLLEVRNAITHPKDIINLVVDADVILRTFPEARSWYYAVLVGAVHDPLLLEVLR